MDDLIFKYYLFVIFFLSIFKSAKKGAKSEAISLFFIIIAFGSSLFFYKPKLTNIIFSLLIFFIIYIIGLFYSYKYEKHGMFQTVGGVIIGILKYILLLTITTSIALLMNSTTSAFEEIEIIKLILPFSKNLSNFIAAL